MAAAEVEEGRGAPVLSVGGWVLVSLLGILGVTYGYLYGAAGLVGGLPAAALFGVMALALSRRGGPGWAVLPFAYVVLAPAVTVPLQITFLERVAEGACTEVPSAGVDLVWECSPVDVLPTLLPGVLNLVPLLWLFSSQRQVRRGALAAGGLGAARLLLPALFWVAEGASVTLIGSYQFPPASPYNASLVASPILWYISLASGAAAGWSVLGRAWVVVLALGAAGALLSVFVVGLGTLTLEL